MGTPVLAVAESSLRYDELAFAHRPLLYFDSREQLRPVDVRRFLEERDDTGQCPVAFWGCGVGYSWFTVGESGDQLTTGSAMLLGEYEHTIDDKNRLTLPAKFREAFAGGVVVTRGLEGCLSAYPREQWERLVASWLDPLSPFSKESRQMHRYYYAGATEDTAGQAGPRDPSGRPPRSTPASSARSSSPGSATGWRSGTAVPGASS